MRATGWTFLRRARPVLLLALCALGVLGLGLSEPEARTFVPVAASAALIFAVAFLLSRRPLWSALLTATLLVTIAGISAAKYAYVAIKFHVYDIVFHALSATEVAFFVATFPRAAALAALALAVALVAFALMWRAEPPAGRPRLRIALVLLTAAATPFAMGSLFEHRADFFVPGRYVLSSFLSSFGDLPRLVRFGGLMEAAANDTSSPAPPASPSCAPRGPRPDIVLFLNESVLPPEVYPKLVFPAETLPMFASRDGRVHRLRVETFGGATWLSDFSVLTGLSTWSFGSARSFVLQFMTGRIAHSLPQYLKACGYDTTMIYPSYADFAGSDRFYRAIGFDRIVDRAVHRAPDERQRDAFYYAQVIETLRRASPGAAPDRPQFIVASGMATHSPWDRRFAPELARGLALDWNGDAEADEFMWRLLLAERDRKAFRATLAREFSSRAVMFVSYGDHQPALRRIPLRDAIRIADDGRAEDLQPTSVGFETYYAIDAQNFTPDLAEAGAAILDIPYLSTVIVQAAGLPADPVFARRRELMQLCGGTYFTCPYRQAILQFHRWLADHGWIRLD